MWPDLFLNLASEGIGILVTVIVIEGFAARRERKRWKRVRYVYFKQVELPLIDILRVWDHWLAASAKGRVKTTPPFSEMDLSLEHKSTGYALRDVYSEARRGRTTLEAALNELSEFLDRKMPRSNDPCWANLQRELEKPVRSLKDILSRYSSSIDMDPAFLLELERILGFVEALPRFQRFYDEDCEKGNFLSGKRRFIPLLRIGLSATLWANRHVEETLRTAGIPRNDEFPY